MRSNRRPVDNGEKDEGMRCPVNSNFHRGQLSDDGHLQAVVGLTGGILFIAPIEDKSESNAPTLKDAAESLQLHIVNFEAATESSERQNAVTRSELLKLAELTSKTMLSLADAARAEFDEVNRARKQLEVDRTQLEADLLQLERLGGQMPVLERKKAEKVTFNFRGKCYGTSIDTLCSGEDNFFTCLLGGKWVAKSDEGDGAIFIDRDGTAFRQIQNYLRDGHNASFPDEVNTPTSIAKDAAFFGLPDLATRAREERRARAQSDSQSLTHPPDEYY
ncbi:hypothetical protein BDK51DRAFT_39771 [Blyttiomyces helicus]|uniref:Potassium channel tetramerisation-type BTB domain-containing protein n=1 Tax=Blyttiomyces helicus TaxID=388810 RepID=A0A4P9WPW9_9FUNG|nr:hypothetical protein BDK51DRAFT_39771 [Blyttiomyces helicus]|eukprot:RKO93310.1 hypothetical protein BDK51DRAFT_39771 [Blyttiomyces helicus]